MLPNTKNFCGGNYQDWLEVNLINKCNAKCSWCVERNGYHPKKHADWKCIAEQAIATGKKNIILLGGEPTLHSDLKNIISHLCKANCSVYITTNGSKLTEEFIQTTLTGVTGVNISIHSYDLEENKGITGIHLENLEKSVKALHSIGASVRLNCNCIAGYIDTLDKIKKYTAWSKEIGADKIRFAELKMDVGSFVDLAKITNYQYGLSDDPFVNGCNQDVVIDGMPVNFRQMCGLQTSLRKEPIDPIQHSKQVLYYDGIIYNGWQIKGDTKMANKKSEEAIKKVLKEILTDMAEGTITVDQALKQLLLQLQEIKGKDAVENFKAGSGCAY